MDHWLLVERKILDTCIAFIIQQSQYLAFSSAVMSFLVFISSQFSVVVPLYWFQFQPKRSTHKKSRKIYAKDETWYVLK